MGKRRNPGVAISSMISLVLHCFVLVTLPPKRQEACSSTTAATWLANHFNVIEMVHGTDVPKKEDFMSDWAKHYYAVVDSMDVEKFAPLHTEDVHLRFGNAETVVGRDPVVRGIADFWGAFKGLRHNFVQTWGEGHLEIVEVSVDYTRHDAP